MIFPTVEEAWAYHTNGKPLDMPSGQAGRYRAVFDQAFALARWSAAPSVEGVIPEIGSSWRHRNGNIYTALFLTNKDSERPEYPPTVVYIGPNAKLWSRPISRWTASSFTEVIGPNS